MEFGLFIEHFTPHFFNPFPVSYCRPTVFLHQRGWNCKNYLETILRTTDIWGIKDTAWPWENISRLVTWSQDFWLGVVRIQALIPTAFLVRHRVALPIAPSCHLLSMGVTLPLTPNHRLWFPWPQRKAPRVQMCRTWGAEKKGEEWGDVNETIIGTIHQIKLQS